MLTDRCITQITANKERCEEMVYNSIGIVTAFSPHIGYEKSSAAAKKALATGRNVIDIIREEGYLTEAQIAEIMKVENLTGPSSLMRKNKAPSLAEMNRSLTHMRVSSVDASFFNNVVLQESGSAANLAMTPAHHRRVRSTAHHFLPPPVSPGTNRPINTVPSSLQFD
jgi:hypothetical protein